MKILSVTGESVPPGKGGSPSDTFDRSIATYEDGGQTKTLTVTYVRYFARLLAERGIYDEEQAGVAVNKLAAVLFLEKHPAPKESRHYFNDADAFMALFEGFSLEPFRAKYGHLALA
ncbi:hypothetical protein LOK74_00375 [Brevibacillus humidisoli]|uniref:hypothetical protein n=1 Tax=Brevibacillus humidisoli TaxID=2895522 RepID=UPI001E2D196A|nr:hypothetical protein [Brevibacillus humidisoli]UFJ41055.1 hypothetical protein LOK74_00375 [Brevibacillus humidisoli]